MNVLLLLVLAQTTRVAVRPETETTCPSPGQIEHALKARVGTALVGYPAQKPQSTLVLELRRRGAEAPQLVLADMKGQVKLERRLTRGAGQDCAALAETAALMVERFLIEVDFKGPAPLDAMVTAPVPPPPQERRWDLSLLTRWRPGNEGLGAVDIGARVGRWFGARRRLLVLLSAGGGVPFNPVPAGSHYPGQARLQRFPAELGVWWRFPAGFAEVQVGVDGGVDITRLRSEDGPVVQTRTLVGPALAVGAALRLPLGSRFFFRLASQAAGGLLRYEFSYQEPNTAQEPFTVFGAPSRRIYAKLSGEIGFVLR